MQERRWTAQRVFFGGSAQFAGLFDPWVDLTPYVIEGLTAEETELYLWQANLVCAGSAVPASHLCLTDFGWPRTGFHCDE